MKNITLTIMKKAIYIFTAFFIMHTCITQNAIAEQNCTAESPEECPAGCYWETGPGGGCTQCTDNNISLNFNSPECFPCGQGTANTAHTTCNCEVGYIIDTNSNPICQPCDSDSNNPNHTTSNDDHTACICEQNYYMDTTTNTCKQCPYGGNTDGPGKTGVTNCYVGGSSFTFTDNSGGTFTLPGDKIYAH